MLRVALLAVAILGLVLFAGCLSKPIAGLTTAATDVVHVDGVFWSFWGYGPWSNEFDDAVNRMGGHYRTYQNDIWAFQETTDKYFFNYDRLSPASE